MTDVLDELYNRQSSIPLHYLDTAIILGLGGVGSWVALLLALSGKVDRLHLIDPDIVESSNLNRTPFTISDMGSLKVDALKFMILERRLNIKILTYPEFTSKELASSIWTSDGETHAISDGVIIDCRDDIFDDFYHIPLKYYKVGYDGLDLTIDGDPKNTPVWGRADSYSVTPSFVCPTVMLANLVVSDILIQHKNQRKSATWQSDDNGRMMTLLSFNMMNMLRDLTKVYRS